MKRVKEGEKYWFIEDAFFEAVEDFDDYTYIHGWRYETGNYFPDKESAVKAAVKLRAVLAGAEVIEMPSEEEIITTISSLKHEKDLDDGETPNVGLYDIGFGEAIYWIKSKIVK